LPEQAGALHTPPPQTSGHEQLPQLAERGLPQLSVPLLLPQFLPRRAQNAPSVSGVHTQTLLVQVSAGGVEQVPQFAVRGSLQLSVPLKEPQFFPSRAQKTASLSAVQAHTPLVQLAGAAQGPQLGTVRLTPQASLAVCEPHARPRRVQKA
jgi:hypothetical protein